jgi:hypothetical protein
VILSISHTIERLEYGPVTTTLLLRIASVIALATTASGVIAWRFIFPVLVVGVLVLVAVVGGFALAPHAATGGERTAGSRSHAPHPGWVFLAATVLGMVFMLAEPVARDRGVAPLASVLIRVGCETLAVVLIVCWSRMREWNPQHCLALSDGTSVTYALFGLMTFVRGSYQSRGPTDWIDTAGQVVLMSAVFLLIRSGSRLSRRLTKGSCSSKTGHDGLSAAAPRVGRRMALTFPLLPPPQKNRSAPSDSSPDTPTPGGSSSFSSTSPVWGSTRLTSLSSPSEVPCQSSPSTHVTPVTKRLDSIVRRIAPESGST